MLACIHTFRLSTIYSLPLLAPFFTNPSPCFSFLVFSSRFFLSRVIPVRPSLHNSDQFRSCRIHLILRVLVSDQYLTLVVVKRMAGDSVPNEVEEEVGKTGGEEEDTGAQIAPIVKLEEVAVTTGEEDEDVLLDMKAKLYRFDKDGNQWKERGVGTVKLLKHKESGKVRLVMRQSKTLKICANHLVLPTISLQEHAGNEKSCVWHATDFSDGELKEELFCIRFGSVENAKKFMEMVEEIAQSQVKKSEEEEEAADSAATLLRDLKVEDQKEVLREVIEGEKVEERLEKREETKEEEKDEGKPEKKEEAKEEQKEEGKPDIKEEKLEAKEETLVEPAPAEFKQEV